MQVTAEQTDPCTLVLDIEVDEQQVARAFESVYREFSRYVAVPGFRPGKAPRAILERYVNQERVRERTLEKILGDSFQKAIEEQGVTPYRNPSTELTDLEDKKPFTYKAIVPLEPQVTLGDYTGLTVEKPLFPITDEAVEARIQRLREDRARLERVTDRGVEVGDVLIAENQVVLEGEEATETPRRQLIQTGGNIPGFDEAILGMMPGEERTFELTYPDDFDEEEKRGKKATFTVRLSSISAKKLPELNDDFAKQIAGVETVEELRQTLKERMEVESAQLSDQIAERRIIEQIVKNSEVYFPHALIHEEVEDELRRLAGQLRENNMSYQQYLTQSGLTPETHQSRLAAEAEARIRTILILRQISIQEGLQPEDEAVDAEFDRLLNEGRITEDQYETYKDDPRRRLQIANALVQQGLHDFLFANNTIHEVMQETPPDPDELEEANAEEEETE